MIVARFKSYTIKFISLTTNMFSHQLLSSLVCHSLFYLKLLQLLLPDVLEQQLQNSKPSWLEILSIVTPILLEALG